MRPFETILVTALALTILLGTLAVRGTLPQALALSRLAAVCLLLALVALGLHLALEGAHWQMFAAYAAIFPAAVLVWAASSAPASLRFAMLLLGSVMLTISCACSYVVPMFHLLQPIGPYPVGTSILTMSDSSRVEDAVPGAGRKRELVVQLWYPAEPAKSRPAPYRRRIETTFESSYQAVLPTHSYLDAAVARAAAPYPVLLFNPGWNGRRTQNTFLTEELASHGYIVAAIDHTYNSEPVAFPDGRVVMAVPAPAITTLANTTPAEVQRIGNDEVVKEAADDRFVLDELARLNGQQGGRWFGMMDTACAGAFGHSLGGAVAVETWATDARVHAAVNMDGWQFGDQSVKAVRAVSASTGHAAGTSPLLYLYEELANSFNAPPSHPEANQTTWTPEQVELAVSAWDTIHVSQLLKSYGGQALVLKGSIHPTFIDKPITSPIRRLSGRSDIDARRAHVIIRDYVVQFFDQALKGKPSPLLSGSTPAHAGSTYPEMETLIRVDAHPADTPGGRP